MPLKLPENRVTGFETATFSLGIPQAGCLKRASDGIRAVLQPLRGESRLIPRRERGVCRFDARRE